MIIILFFLFFLHNIESIFICSLIYFTFHCFKLNNLIVWSMDLIISNISCQNEEKYIHTPPYN